MNSSNSNGEKREKTPNESLSAGQASAGNRSGHASWLMAELASAKTQEQCLVQILSRCSHELNKLKVEEMQLHRLAMEERQCPGSGIQNGVMSPSSVLSINSVDRTDDNDDETMTAEAPNANLLASDLTLQSFPGWK